MKTKTWFVRFFKCSFVLMVGAVIFELDKLYTINNLCVVIEIIASYFPYGLKFMSRDTLSAPQPDSASYLL